MALTSCYFCSRHASAFEKNPRISFHPTVRGHQVYDQLLLMPIAGGGRHEESFQNFGGSSNQSFGKEGGDGKEESVVTRTTPVLGASAHAIDAKQVDSSGNTFWFSMVTFVCITNAFINILRPDPDISIQARLPRCMWEGYIALCGNYAASNWRQSQTVLVLLAIMTGTTALIDIFIWAPLFAAFAEFKTCEGGWFTGSPRVCYSDYTKGVGRLFVSAFFSSSNVYVEMCSCLCNQLYLPYF